MPRERDDDEPCPECFALDDDDHAPWCSQAEPKPLARPRSSSSGFEPTALRKPIVEALGEVLHEPGPQLIRLPATYRISRVLVVDKRVNRQVRLLVRAQAAPDGVLTLQVDDE